MRVGVEAAVEGDHAGAGGQNVVGHGLQQRLREFLVDRDVGRIEQHAGQAGVRRAFEVPGAVGRQHELLAAGGLLQLLPIGRSFQQKQHSLDADGFGQLDAGLDHRPEFVVESNESRHAPPRLPTMSTPRKTAPRRGKSAADRGMLRTFTARGNRGRCPGSPVERGGGDTRQGGTSERGRESFSVDPLTVRRVVGRKKLPTPYAIYGANSSGPLGLGSFGGSLESTASRRGPICFAPVGTGSGVFFGELMS